VDDQVKSNRIDNTNEERLVSLLYKMLHLTPTSMLSKFGINEHVCTCTREENDMVFEEDKNSGLNALFN
jgi:hypothetical protein